MNLRQKIATVLVAAAAFAGGTAAATADAEVKVEPVSSARPAGTGAPLKLPTRPCSEDNTVITSCYWDAAKMGNGKGYSYVIDARGRVVYLNPRLNSIARRVAFNEKQARAGRELWGTYNGHQFCWAKVGDTSYVECFDGYKETT
ncbi:hypothetical protein NX794_07755 [Streptomyces sp. LP11]|uniref:Secreted protein n=1 Tax=Streptomyces pyxinicus TaxID=2970331 RepID=A0ABT2AZ23_9ACTN|nr:hypothetical protein [Streptomyces sp. LP11]MCS0601125.1 hypothetical protein [Streptomyces sp. LP11]